MGKKRVKITGGFHKYAFGFWVGYYPLRGTGKYLDFFLPFAHVTISWGVYNDTAEDAS